MKARPTWYFSATAMRRSQNPGEGLAKRKGVNREVASEQVKRNKGASGIDGMTVNELHIVGLASEGEAGRALQEAMEIIIVARRIGRHRGMEEPALLDIDAAEELPVALEVGMHDSI